MADLSDIVSKMRKMADAQADRAEAMAADGDLISQDKKYRSAEDNARFREIRGVLARNKITRGISPEKLRIILEELGPTYIKLGQIMSMHSDILPKRYCDELAKLNFDVPPMPFSEVIEIIEESYGCSYLDVFEHIEENALGAASIAQVHRATLKKDAGEGKSRDVIIKVQRRGVFEVMSRDISLLHRLVKLMPPVGDLKNIVDLDMVLDEMWTVAREEMDFFKEACNIAEFKKNNKDIRYVGCPDLYMEYTTDKVLVMEYIGGCAIDDVEYLVANGYDLEEIGKKFVNSFIKQVMDDGFFHADPHPGNVRIMDGKIIWLDMGMMGRLSDRDRRLMVRGVRSIAMHDIQATVNAVIDLGDVSGKPDRDKLYGEIKTFLDQYGSVAFGSLDISAALQSLMDIMKENGIALPHGMTMLCRGLAHVQGVLATISPDINMMQIATTKIMSDFMENLDLTEEMSKYGRAIYRAADRGIEIPVLLSQVMKEYLAGQSKVNININPSKEFDELIYSSIRNMVIGLGVAALLIASSVMCTTSMEPRVFGIPVLGAVGFSFAMVVSGFLILRNIGLKILARRRRRRR
ncbi:MULTISPECIES: ABC1 kinase family protein [unclassified Butyrivibrio]|uniref:ABC1 kinase family protein n=1 Tax=unclassified Butyrivibrio TaxID=2639466 RepID=UPI000400D530|nr:MULTISPECIES: AarF/UbiB family protein [unclassified Butyrivibrio]